jgi:hypothetical protein
MVRMRRIQLADHRDRDATVLLVPVGESKGRRYQDTEGRPVRSVRRIRSTGDTCADALLARYYDPDDLARSLIDGDPDIDLEIAGRATGPCDRVHMSSTRPQLSRYGWGKMAWRRIAGRSRSAHRTS